MPVISPGEFLSDEEKLLVSYGKQMEAVKSVRYRLSLDLRTAHSLIVSWTNTAEAKALGVLPRMQRA